MPTPVNPAKIVVRIDWDALVRGWPVDDEVCEIAGTGKRPMVPPDDPRHPKNARAGPGAAERL